MDHIETLRRLANHDPGILAQSVARDPAGSPLPQRDVALARLAATVATGGSAASYSVAVDAAISAQLTVPELVDVLVALTPIVGLPRAVSAAQHVLVALDLADDDAAD